MLSRRRLSLQHKTERGGHYSQLRHSAHDFAIDEKCIRFTHSLDTSNKTTPLIGRHLPDENIERPHVFRK